MEAETREVSQGHCGLKSRSRVLTTRDGPCIAPRGRRSGGRAEAGGAGAAHSEHTWAAPLAQGAS